MFHGYARYHKNLTEPSSFIKGNNYSKSKMTFNINPLSLKGKSRILKLITFIKNKYNL